MSVLSRAPRLNRSLWKFSIFTARRWVMNSMAIELLAPRYAIAWYPWAVQYFFLIAISYATLWLAAPALIFGKQRWLPTARLALLACFTTSLVAPVALLADLHQPLRFWHFYAYGTPSSWMAIGDRKSTRLNSSHVAISYA